jgi:rhamnulokinase
MTRHYLAYDLGAESGRLISGTLENGKLSLQEIHRFANTPRRIDGSLHWNIPNLIVELKEGLRKAARTGFHYESISTDSWGVDYILFTHVAQTLVCPPTSSVEETSADPKSLTPNPVNPVNPVKKPLTSTPSAVNISSLCSPCLRGESSFEILEPIYHYRDPRTKRGVEIAYSRTTWPEIFSESGIQFMPINTLFQLASEDPARLESAQFLLGVGDAFNYFLTGGMPKIEVSMASTFQLYNPRTRQWSDKLINALQLPRHIFPEIVPSATPLGPLRPDLASELGIPQLQVIATCSHDTGAAVAGVPAQVANNSAYLSSGTWSLMGVELAEPVINDTARELNFTNEIGYGNSVRLLKNISGLWLLQECKRQWSREGREFDYATLTALASEAQPFASLINPASDEFLAPENMVSQFVQFCRRTAQPAPKTEGAFVRCALESLALLYRRTLRQIEQLTSRKIELLHVVGGGSNNDLLNQFTANATGIPVLAGPAEATAAGNIMLQAIALGHVDSLAAAREIIRNSSQLRRFEPRDREVWDRAFTRFESLLVPAASPQQKQDAAQLASAHG